MANSLCHALRFSHPSVVTHPRFPSVEHFSECTATDSSHTAFNLAKQTAADGRVERAKRALCTRESYRVACAPGEKGETAREDTGWRWQGDGIVLTMFRAGRVVGCAEITDQGVSKQLRCRREVKPWSSVTLEATVRRNWGLWPAAGCGRELRLPGSALSSAAANRRRWITSAGRCALLFSDIPSSPPPGNRRAAPLYPRAKRHGHRRA